MVAMPDTTPNVAHDLLGVRGVAEAVGVSRSAIFQAIRLGRLHPIKIRASNRLLIFRTDMLAWRLRQTWRPTPEELAALVASGYNAEDFTPAPPIEPASASPSGGAAEASGAFVAPSDLLAAMQHYMRESQALTASVAPLVGSATESAMRGWRDATGASASPSDVADMAARVTESAIRPIAETIRANVAPLTEAMAQAALPRPIPPTEDVIARQMGALRVELAQLLTRIMDAIRPMVERLAAGSYVTSEDIAPFMGLVGELAMSLAGSPFYELAPRDAPALMPGLLAQAIADGAQATPEATPAPDAGKE